MFGLTTLDVLIGLITVYLAFGIACTAIVDAAAGILRKRGKYLDQALRALLAGKLSGATSFIDAFYDHPLLQTLNHKYGDNPSWFVKWRRRLLFQSNHSYVPQDIVGRVVADIILPNKDGASIAEAVKALPGSATDNRIKGLLTTIVNEVGEDSVAFKKAIESQFSAAMDRTSNRYKAFAQRIAFLAAFALVVGANVDTIAIAKSLALNPAARTQLVQDAQQLTAKGDAKQSADDSLKQAEAVLESSGLQVGWNEIPIGRSSWLEKIAGLLVSIFAVSLGAPFWFKALQRFMQARESLTPENKASE